MPVIRLIQIALLIAVMIPVAWAIKSGVFALPIYWRDMAFAGLVGFLICGALWRWSDRINQREGDGRRSD